MSKHAMFLLVATLLCASCRTDRLASEYETLYRKRHFEHYEVSLQEREGSVRFYVEHDGCPISEVEIYPDWFRNVSSRYGTDPDSQDSYSLLYRGPQMMAVYRWSDAKSSFMMTDKDGDGLPEKRTTTTGDKYVFEDIKHTFYPSKKKQPK